MARQVEWTAEALADVDEIVAYIGPHSPMNASAVVKAIDAAASRVVDFPYANRIVPEWADPERRETFVHRWRLMYRVLPDRVRIVGIIHGSRLLENIEDRSFQEGPQQEYVAS